jgi:alanyl-tRNA synthetase
MTDRLYYNDPYLREFDATVRRIDREGARAEVVLDRTAFYPTSGGQPFDTGTLATFRVTNVRDDDDGAIVHEIEAGENGLPDGLSAGDVVHGAIDWPRRFDHMQQHTGQHVLSAAFDRAFGVRTTSFHMGAAAATIDLAREVTPREVSIAEDDANRIVWEDRPVSIRYASASEAAALPLRKESVRAGTLRLVAVAEYDLSACGGTHVGRTGEIGDILVGGVERFKGGSRVEFLCGARALARFRSLRDTTAASMRLLSVGADELASSIERLQADFKEQRRAAAALQADLAKYRAGELRQAAESIDRRSGGPLKFVGRAIDADAARLKALASAVVGDPSTVAVLVSCARPALAVIARSSDAAVDVNAVLAALHRQFGGRGGGRGEIAQGGGLDAAPETLIAAARALISAHQ